MARKRRSPEAIAKGNKNIKPWKKGQSGNPKGKPKGAKDRSTVLAEMLKHKMLNGEGVAIKNPFTQKGTITLEEGVDAALIKKALGGNIEAIKEIKDTMHGKITEKKEIGGPGGGAIPVMIVDDIQ